MPNKNIVLVVVSLLDNLSRTNFSQEVKGVLERAEELCDEERYMEAINLYETVLKYRKDEMVANNMGVAFDAVGKHEKAIESYHLALKINPNYVTAWHNKGNSHIYLGEYRKALECYDEIIQLQPKNYQAYFDKAFAYARLGRSRAAKKWADEGVKRGKIEIDELLIYKGEIYEEIDDYKGAIIIYQRAREKNPSNLEALKKIADALMDLGRYHEAIENYDDYLDYVPDDEEVWNNKGYGLFSLGHYQESKACYQRALNIDPHYGPAHYNMGYLLHTSGDYKEAIIHYKEASKYNTDNEVLWNNLGNALYNLEKYEESVPYFVKAIEVNPEYEIAWNNIGNAQNKMGVYEESIEYHQRALEIKPDFDYALLALGYALAKTGKKEEGVDKIDLSLDLNPDYEKSWYVRAEILHMMGRYEDALESLKTALDKNPLFADAHRLTGEILEYTQNYDEALLAFNKALKVYDKLYTRYNDFSALIDKGELLEELGRFRDALKVYETALRDDDGKVYVWRRKAAVHLELEEYREALIAADEGLAIEESADLLILKGEAYKGLDNKEKALEYLRSAVEKDGPEARIALARYLSDLEKFDEALEVIEEENWEEKLTKGNIFLEIGEYGKAVPLFKSSSRENDLDAWFGLGKALSATGDLKGASKAYDTCIGLSEDFGPAWYEKALLLKTKKNFKRALEYAQIAADLGVPEAVTLAEELGKKV